MAEGRIIAVYGTVGHGDELADQFRKAFPDGDVRLFVPGVASDGAESIPEDVKGEAAQRNWIN